MPAMVKGPEGGLEGGGGNLRIQGGNGERRGRGDVPGAGERVGGVAEFVGEWQGAGRSEATLRSYAHDLLRWFRFLWAVEVPWDRATRIEARDFCRWMLVAGKPSRPHWRSPDGTSSASGEAYAPSVRAHSETVVRCFYQFHVEAGRRPRDHPLPPDPPPPPAPPPTPPHPLPPTP